MYRTFTDKEKVSCFRLRVHFGMRRDDVIYHEPWTEMSYCWWHQGAALDYCRASLMEASLQQKKERQRADIQEPFRVKNKQLNLDLKVCLQTWGSSSLSDSCIAGGDTRPECWEPRTGLTWCQQWQFQLAYSVFLYLRLQKFLVSCFGHRIWARVHKVYCKIQSWSETALACYAPIVIRESYQPTSHMKQHRSKNLFVTRALQTGGDKTSTENTLIH